MSSESRLRTEGLEDSKSTQPVHNESTVIDLTLADADESKPDLSPIYKPSVNLSEFAPETPEAEYQLLDQ